jgi:hypothetical protein
MASDPTLIFLDANVLARPVTRTLLLAGADEAGLAVTWSAHAEAEAGRHMPGADLPVWDLRKRLERELGPTGSGPERFTATSPSDRQILADVDAARTSFPVTGDVDDFGEADLAALRATGIHPDLFMALRFPRHAYQHALDLLVANMKNPPRTAAQMHGLIARQHPRLFSAHADAYNVQPSATPHAEPGVLVQRTGHPSGDGDEGRSGQEYAEAEQPQPGGIRAYHGRAYYVTND